ncbi:MAG: hypothetical protein BWY78_00353 [Alphaproteobacteria bacterium ADurb.Bin438]|nr:MAG: hypothetical protein BWY78_00353 [Alphaproteobacteria bacterium ADurb.Bin438]
MTSWQRDTKRDMFTYRYIELTTNLVEAILTDNEEDMIKYKQWLSMVNGTNPDGITIDNNASVLAEITPEQDSKINIIAMKDEGNFVAEFKTPVFQATINLIYDFEKYDIVAASVMEFSGDMMIALSWSEQMLTKIDEMRIA